MASLNDLLAAARWRENGKVRSLDNNVHLAKAIRDRTGGKVSQSYIHALRQGLASDPRWSVLCGICKVLTEKSGIDITPNYFYDADENRRVLLQLRDQLEALREGA